MKNKIILAAVLVTALPILTQAQTILRPGDSLAWPFQFQYVSTEQVNSPDQPYGSYVTLDYSHFPQAGDLQYRVGLFEDFDSPQPLLSLPVDHLTSLVDQTGMPLVWLPEFSPPPDAWSDFDGVLRLTVVSGEMRNLSPHISMLVPASPGFMDYFEAAVIPEPGSLALVLVGGAFLMGRRNRAPSHSGQKPPGSGFQAS